MMADIGFCKISPRIPMGPQPSQPQTAELFRPRLDELLEHAASLIRLIKPGELRAGDRGHHGHAQGHRTLHRQPLGWRRAASIWSRPLARPWLEAAPELQPPRPRLAVKQGATPIPSSTSACAKPAQFAQQVKPVIRDIERQLAPTARAGAHQGTGAVPAHGPHPHPAAGDEKQAGTRCMPRGRNASPWARPGRPTSLASRSHRHHLK